MPRGGSKKGGNNPLFGDNQITATPDELRQLTRHALELLDAKTPDLFNVDEVNETVYNYFKSCDRNGVRPSNLGLYAAIGLSKQEVHNIVSGRDKNKVSPAVCDLLKKCKRILSTYRESLVMAGKVNPVTAIFWAKNFDGMEDSTRIEVSADSNQRANLTPEQIARQIEQDIPIDSDYKEL